MKNPTVKEQAIQENIKSPSKGNQYIQKHNDDIERLADKHDVDPDLVKAVMWTENARGNRWGVNELVDILSMSRSQAPMNISGQIWSELVNKEKGSRLNNEEENIEAGVILLKRIKARIENPTPAKIGSIYNFTGRENTNEIGAEVERAYKTKPWEKTDKPD